MREVQNATEPRGTQPRGYVTTIARRARTHGATIVSAVAWVVCLGLTLAGGEISARAADRLPAITIWQVGAAWLSSTAAALAFATVGLLLTARRPDLRIGIACSGLGVVMAIGYCAWQYVRSAAALGLATQPLDPGVVGSLNGSINLSVGILLIIRLTLVFPDGRVASSAWRTVGAVGIVLAILASAGMLLGDGSLLVHPDRLNPLALGGAPGAVARVGGLAALGLLVGCSGVSALSLVGRYRAGNEVVRQQLKWYAYGQAVLTIATVAYVVTTPWTYVPTAGLAEFAWAGLMTAAVVPPVATALAIQRHGLYEIDRIIGRTIVYSALTAILTGLYGALTQVLGSVFETIAGDHAQLTIVLTTLIITISFTPLRDALNRFVQRRFETTAPTPPGSSPDAGGRVGRREGDASRGPGGTESGGDEPPLAVSQAELERIVEQAVDRALDHRGIGTPDDSPRERPPA